MMEDQTLGKFALKVGVTAVRLLVLLVVVGERTLVGIRRSLNWLINEPNLGAAIRIDDIEVVIDVKRAPVSVTIQDLSAAVRRATAELTERLSELARVGTTPPALPQPTVVVEQSETTVSEPSTAPLVKFMSRQEKTDKMQSVGSSLSDLEVGADGHITVPPDALEESVTCVE